MSSLKYWEHRQAQRMFEYMQSAEDTADEVSKLYQKASGYISRELDRIFERYKRKHHLTDAEAYRLLNTLRDKTSLDELKKALKAPGRGQTAADLLAELESPAYQARLERLQQLQNQIDLAMQEIYNQEKVRNTSHYVDLANEAYYKSIFDIQQRTGLGFSFSLIDPKVIETVINSKWSGENYSKRIWNNTRSLAQTLKEELLVNLITGRTDREAAEIIANKYAQGASNARRLVRTESCNLANQMEMLSYKECGIETYIYVATLDLKTSDICQSLDGKRFPVADQQPGKNCPPMHPWCRSTTISDISDEELAQMERRARNPETGKTITVPADMTYSKWYSKFVKSSPLNEIRAPVDIEFDVTVSGYKKIEGGCSVRSKGIKYDQETKIVTLNKRNTIKWDELSSEIKKQLQHTSTDKKPFHLAKGSYEVQRYVEGSRDCIERDEIARALDAEYLGFTFQRKNNYPFFVDFYQKGDDLFYAVGKADMHKNITDASLEMVKKITAEREKLIVENIGETNLKNIPVRGGDEWVSAMKEFHHFIRADGKPSVLSDAAYDAVQTPVLYRGLAPQSNLRRDITVNSTTREMADEFFNSDIPFPSRGVYGDGIAYASPSHKKIALHYATTNA